MYITTLDIQKAYDRLLAADGTVYLRKDPEPTEGYIVGVRGLGLRFGDALVGTSVEREAVIFWAYTVADQFVGEFGGYETLGSWTDSDTGDKSYDVGYIVTDKDVAVLAARREGQRAIWDIKNGREVRV